MRKPNYFIENQTGENRHESLTPTMSALLLTAHVKDGAELAKSHGLPPAVIDIVEQHHGTSLMTFFYQKALENGQARSYEANERDFRYPGPKPAGKEAGLVMLADVCEAAARTLTEPTPVKIGEMVRSLLNRIFNDGQLDECDLTLRELTRIVEKFTNILVGIYHHRIAYPALRTKEALHEQAARSKAIYADLSNQPPGRLPH
jgi:membrane-associated HD superfamily phosphohydrolase